MIAVAALTRLLLAHDTAADGEDAALHVLAPMLENAGLDVTIVPWRPGRSNLVATWNGGGRLVLSGHVDTVPHRRGEWTFDPFAGETHNGRIFGLGASDMKGGVAALVLAAIAAANRDAEGFGLVLTSSEETGCEGAEALASTGLLPPDAVLVLGEATGNALRYGHKGATWLRLTASGRAAHASRPELGRNAIEALSDAIQALRELDPGAATELGRRTTSVGMIEGGVQPNLVPALARMIVDVRTVPGAGPREVGALLEDHGLVEELLSIPSVWSDPGSDLSRAVRDAVESVTGVRASGDSASGVAYFTDAARLDPSLARSYIIGPGDADQPHTADESVAIENLEQAVEIYGAIIDRIA